MLSLSLTTNATGVILLGDEAYLKALYDELSAVAPISTDGEKVNGIVDGAHVEYALGFCYEIRKTYTGCREVVNNKAKNKTYMKREVLPVFLLWLRLFHHFAKASKKPTFLLDKLITDLVAIISVEAGVHIAEMVNQFIKSGAAFNQHYRFNIAENAMYQYLIKDTKAQRFKELPGMLQDMMPSSSFYREYLALYKQYAKEQNCDINAIGNGEYDELITTIFEVDENGKHSYRW